MKKWLKQICATILVVTLVLSLCTVFGTEVEGEVCALNAGEIGLLKHLDIISSENPDFSAEVTRGELAYMIAKLCNITQNENMTPSTEFYDLSKDHEYYWCINECVARGIFSGDGTGYFRPDDTATFQEACKVFSVALGYKLVGYLNSYVETARDSGIIDGVNQSEKLTLGVAAELSHNALHTGMFEAISYGDKQTYKVNEDYTALEHYHKLKMGRGILDGFYGTTLAMADGNIPENEIRIDGQRYLYSGGEKLLGRTVIFYAGEHEAWNNPNIEYIYPDEDANREISVLAENMMGKSGEIITYYDGSKERRINFSGTGDVIINGVSYPEYGNADFKPASGNITFIDNNADNIFDVAIIKEYKYMIVGGIDLENKLIYDKNDATNVLGSKTDSNIVLKLLRNEDEAHMSILGIDSAVAVCKSRNKDGIVKINVYIPDQTVTGMVDAVGSNYLGIDGERYQLASDVLYDEEVSIGDVVALNVFRDRVGVIIHKKDGYLYGYLVDATTSKSAFNPTLTVKLMTSARKEMTYECGKSVRVDESVCKNAETALSLLQTSAGLTYQQYSTHPYSQPIRYKVNTDGVLTHIDTLTYNEATETSDSLQLDKNWSVHKFFASSYGFYTDEVLEYAIASNTTALVVPRKFRGDVEWYSGSFSNNANYVVEAYNVDEYTCAPKFLVAYAGLGESQAVSGGAVPYIVTDIESTLNEEGEVVQKITVVGTSTTPLQRVINKDVPDVQLEVGDVIRFNGGYNDEIILMEKVVSAGKTPSSRLINYGEINGPEFQATIRHAFGTVVASKDGVLVHTTSITDDDGGVENYENRNVYRVNANIPVYVYDSQLRKPTVTQGLWTDIVPYETDKGNPTRAFICTTSGTLRYVYIFK